MFNFFNKYPYLDNHELNLDWVLDEMQALDRRLNEALEQLSEDIYNHVMTDIRPELNAITTQFSILRADFETIKGQFASLDAAFEAYKIYIDGKILYLRGYIDAQAIACNEYTNLRISQNNDYILSELSTYLSQIKVVNFFTGEQVSVQDMFDYLAGLHTTDSIDYDTMALRAKTYTELAAFNKTYTELVMNGNTWYV